MKNDVEIVLELVHEAKISDLLKLGGLSQGTRHEASGVYLKDGYLHIVFDNLPHVMRLRPDWYRATVGPTLQVLPLDGEGAGYEDITYEPETGRWYGLIEAVKEQSGNCRPHIDVFDDSFGFIDSHCLNFRFENDKKGFEGLSTFSYLGCNYLLGLCEGNEAKSGKAGKDKGKGRIQVFEQVMGSWKHVGTIKLPEVVRFKDYSSLDFRFPYMTVLSQKTSAVWVGRIRDNPTTSLDDLFGDSGQLYRFPRDDKGRKVYGNLEGVAWLDDGQLAVVSDKKKRKQPKCCTSKDQSIHIFRLPDGFQDRRGRR
jgi:hypothetical protein